MTDLERNCICALRLSEASAEALIDSIRNYIEIAKAEIIRLGISEEIANDESDKLVCNLIMKYVTYEMASVESERDKAFEAFRVCVDELRKSYVE